jgi:hypothetical protein
MELLILSYHALGYDVPGPPRDQRYSFVTPLNMGVLFHGSAQKKSGCFNFLPVVGPIMVVLRHFVQLGSLPKLGVLRATQVCESWCTYRIAKHTN